MGHKINHQYLLRIKKKKKYGRQNKNIASCNKTKIANSKQTLAGFAQKNNIKHAQILQNKSKITITTTQNK